MAISSLLCEVNESGFCYVAQCDRCPVRVQAKGDQYHYQSRQAAMEAAQREGWLVTAYQTLCSACRRKRVR